MNKYQYQSVFRVAYKQQHRKSVSRAQNVIRLRRLTELISAAAFDLHGASTSLTGNRCCSRVTTPREDDAKR